MRLCSSPILHKVLAGAMTSLCIVLLLGACSASMPSTQRPLSPSLSSELDAFLSSQAKSQQFRGAVLVAHHGTLLLSKGYDLANTDMSLPNTPTTMFGLGSLTKEFTAMAILILQERGKLRIHDPICIYLSPCPQAWQPITISQLLTHSSGIPNHFERDGINLVHLEKEPLDFKPGTQFTYSNSGYVVLATIIEKVSGESYGTFLQQNIFAPLRMTHTGYDFTQTHLAGMATGYSAWQTKVDETGITLEFGADGLYSTIEDLYRWDQALFMHDQTLVSRQTLDEMFTNAIALCPTAQAPTCSPSTVFAAYHRPLEAPTYASLLAIRYGYGWFITSVEGSKSPIIYHGGLTFGFTTYNTFYPDSNTIIIVLSNLETANSVNLTQILHEMVTVAT